MVCIKCMSLTATLYRAKTFFIFADKRPHAQKIPHAISNDLHQFQLCCPQKRYWLYLFDCRLYSVSCWFVCVAMLMMTWLKMDMGYHSDVWTLWRICICFVKPAKISSRYSLCPWKLHRSHTWCKSSAPPHPFLLHVYLNGTMKWNDCQLRFRPTNKVWDPLISRSWNHLDTAKKHFEVHYKARRSWRQSLLSFCGSKFQANPSRNRERRSGCAWDALSMKPKLASVN